MSKKVLITDDQVYMRLTLRSMLEKNGYEIAGEAATGGQALEFYQQCRPDLVTMDITMPDMNGIEAVEEIVKIDPGAKILIISAYGQNKLLARAISAGAKDFLLKPFQEEMLVETLNGLMH